MERVICVLVLGAVWLGCTSARLLHHDRELLDTYLERVQRDCKQGNSALGCLKYRTLEFVQRVTNDPTPSVDIWGPVSLVKTPPSSVLDDEPKTGELRPRAAESELGLMYEFATRQLERYLSTHALTVSTGEQNDVTDSGRATAAGRGKKKKALRIFLPLFLLLKIKLITLVTLALVLGIKKLLLVAMIAGPLLLTKLKLASLGHHTPEVVYSSPPHHDHHHTSSVDYGDSSYGGHPYGGWGNYRRTAAAAAAYQDVKT